MVRGPIRLTPLESLNETFAESVRRTFIVFSGSQSKYGNHTLEKCTERQCSPNEDVGRANKPFRMRLPGKHFSTACSPNIPTQTTILEGRTNVSECLFEALLCSPNEDLGRRNKRGNPDFRYTLQWFVAQIEYSCP